MFQYRCSSNVGRQGGNQTVSLDDGCITPTSVKHELMHAIGFYHEQSRRDRDKFVIIHRDNIQRGIFSITYFCSLLGALKILIYYNY